MCYSDQEKTICTNCNFCYPMPTEWLKNMVGTNPNLTVCIKCHKICFFNEQFNLVPLATEDLEDLKNNIPSAWQSLQEVIDLYKSKHEKSFYSNFSSN